MKVALIGLGEVGGLIAEDLASGSTLSAYDLEFGNAESAPSANARTVRLRAASDHADAVNGADVIICAVTAAQTQAAARATSPGISAGAWYLDLNSSSPGAKTAAASTINDAGGRYIEASVMSPFPQQRRASPILLGGPYAEAFEPFARRLGFKGVTVFSDTYGKAAAAKLCRSVMVKGIEALLTESLLAARRHGVEDAVLTSLTDLFPGCDWPTLSRYMISRSIAHGQRRAEEMREAASTVGEAGIAPLMSSATAERQDWAADFRAALNTHDLVSMLDQMRLEIDRK